MKKYLPDFKIDLPSRKILLILVIIFFVKLFLGQYRLDKFSTEIVRVNELRGNSECEFSFLFYNKLTILIGRFFQSL